MLLRLIPVGVLCAVAGLTALAAPAVSGTHFPEPAHRNDVLTLAEALTRTLARGPELVIATEELRAAEAEAQAAGRLPNPELSVSLENVAGNGAYSGTDAAELTIELSQPIELGGKRRLRREAAELGRQLAVNGEKLARAEVQAETSRRFIAVLAAQERLALAREQAELATKSLHAAEERIKAGKAPAIDRLRLQGEAGQAALEVTRAERTVQAAQQSLAASWGDVQPDFDWVEGDLGDLPEVPALSDLDAAFEQSAEALNRRIATELSGTELARARADRLPDPSLTVGWRQFEENDANAWLFGISFPLPLFNRGEETVAAASSRYHVARAREESARHQTRAALRGAWQALADAKSAADIFASQIVPAAAEGFAAAEFGYQAGKFGLLELLDAQRTLFEVRQQMLASRTECHLAAIELHRLQGAQLPVATR
jgi:cobalt-zinc-cadmium efflux system outer membrane protein